MAANVLRMFELVQHVKIKGTMYININIDGSPTEWVAPYKVEVKAIFILVAR